MCNTTSCADGAQVSPDNDYLSPWTERVYDDAEQFQKRRPRSRSRDVAELMWSDARVRGLPSVAVHNMEKLFCLIAATYNPGSSRYIDAETDEEEHYGMAKAGRRTIHHAWRGSLEDIRRQSGITLKDRQLQYLLEVYQELGYIHKLTRGIRIKGEWKGKYILFHPNLRKLTKLCDIVIAKRKKRRVPATPAREDESKLLEEDKHYRMVMTIGYDEEVAAGKYDASLFSPNSRPAENCGCNTVPSGRPVEGVESSPTGADPEGRMTSEKNESRGTRPATGARPSGDSISVSSRADTPVASRCVEDSESGVTPVTDRDAVRSAYDTSSCSRNPGVLGSDLADPKPGSRLVDLREFYFNAPMPKHIQEHLVWITEREARLLRIFAAAMVEVGVKASDPSDRTVMEKLLDLIRYRGLTEQQITLVTGYLLEKYGDSSDSRQAYGRTLRQLVMRWDDMLKAATEAHEFSQVLAVLKDSDGTPFVVDGEAIRWAGITPMQMTQYRWAKLVRQTSYWLAQPMIDKQRLGSVYMTAWLKLDELMGSTAEWQRFKDTDGEDMAAAEDAFAAAPEAFTRFWIWAMEPMLYTDRSELGELRGDIAMSFANSLAGGNLSPRRPFGSYGQTFLKVTACYAPEWLPLMERAVGGVDTSEWTDLMTSKTLQTMLDNQSANRRAIVLDAVCKDNAAQGLRRQAVRAVCKRTGIKMDHARVFYRDESCLSQETLHLLKLNKVPAADRMRDQTAEEWQQFWAKHEQTQQLVNDLRN